MPEVLRVKAKPGVLALDHRALPARRFIGRDHAPPTNGPGLSLGHIAPGLYDPGKLHLGEPVDVDELFPIRETHDEIVFHVDAKHPHVAHKEREHHRKVKQLVAHGALLAHDEHTAKKCGVPFEVAAKADGTPTEVHGDGSGHPPPEVHGDDHGIVSNEAIDMPAEEPAK